MRTATRDRTARLAGTVRTVPVRLVARVQSAQPGQDREAGMTTAEYAMGTVT